MLVEEFLLEEAKFEHGAEFFNHPKNSYKEGRIQVESKRQGGFLLLSGQVLQFKCEKDCF